MNRTRLPVRTIAVVALAAARLLASCGDATAAETCARADFEGVVGAASTTLRDMTARNTPTFQEKLRQLKDRRGWNYDQFVAEAAPFVADDRIGEFDAKSADHLNRINTLSNGASEVVTPDCKLLETLRGEMAALVETQTEKWKYMFAKLEAELAK